MGFFNKIKNQLESIETRSKKSHIKNLFMVALSDGRLDNREFDFILHVADKMYLDRNVVREIHSELDDVSLVVPVNNRQKIDQIYDLIHLTIIDGSIDNREVLACKNIFIQFGYRPVIFEIILQSVLTSLTKNILKDEIIKLIIAKHLK